MMIRIKPLQFVLIACLAVLMTSLACSIDLGDVLSDDINTEQTLAALQVTQTALANHPPDEPAEQPDITAEVTQPAEPEEMPDIFYEGIGFSFDSSIGTNVNAATVPAQDMGEESMPGETYPTHYEFTFGAYTVGDHFHTAKILIYPVNEYLAINPNISDSFNALQQALAHQPIGGLHEALPFLPMWNAAQVFNACVEYLDFQNGSGLRYLTMYGQALYPVDNQNLFYTYQGITYDGQYYLSAVLPVIHTGLPNDGSSEVDDWEEFSNNFNTYISDTITWLEAQDSNTFFPSLNVLDDMMASFDINR
jgi:hypothetical protein